MNRTITWYSKFNYWDQMYQLLLVYTERKGDSNVPQRFEEEREKIGQWLSKQREGNKKGKLKQI